MSEPPYCSPTVIPSRPMSPIFRHRSMGNSLLRSISSARGAISAAAKPLICSRSMSRVSPRPKLSSEYCDFIVGYLVVLESGLCASSRSGDGLFGFFLPCALLFLFLLQVFQCFAAPGFGGFYFHFRLGDVVFLLFQLGAPVGEDFQHLQKLFFVTGEGFVPQVEQFSGFCQGEAHALAPENELQPNPVFGAEDPGLAPSGGLEQALILVESDASGCYIELLRELADTEGSFFAHDDFLFRPRLDKVYVNVKWFSGPILNKYNPENRSA